MPNTSYSEAMKEAATMADTDTVILDTIEISHPDIDSIYLVNDRAPLTAATGPGDGVLVLPGVVGNRASVTAAQVTKPTDYMDARIIFGEDYRDNPNFDGDVIPFSHYNNSSQAWYIKVNSSGNIQFPTWSTAGVLGNFNSASSIPTTADGVRVVFRGTDDLDPSQASAQFFYTLDGGATWVENTNRAYASSAATYSLKQGTAAYSLGERDGGTVVPFHGTIEKAEIYGAAGEADLRLRVDFATAPNGGASFVNDEGITVSIDTSGAGDVAMVTRTDSVTYEPVGFKFKLPAITGNGVQDMSLEFSNVDRRVNDFIESVEASIEPVVVVHRVYISGGDLNSQSENSPPLRLTLSDIEISAFTVRARASFLNIVNKHFPTSYYDRDRFPSI